MSRELVAGNSRDGLRILVVALTVALWAAVIAPAAVVLAEDEDTTPPFTAASIANGPGSATVTLTPSDYEDDGAWVNVDNTAGGWTYTGTWVNEPEEILGELFGGSIHINESNPATATYTFTGTTVEYFSTRCENQAECAAHGRVLIDGQLRGLTSTFGQNDPVFGTHAPQSRMFGSEYLGAGSHTFQLIADANFMGVDYIRYRTPGTVGSGVGLTEYRLNEGDWTEYAGPFVINTPGHYNVEYRSTDAEGNIEQIRGRAVVISGVASPPYGPDPIGLHNPHMEKNGVAHVYPRAAQGFDGFNYPTTPYSTITAQINSNYYADRGINHLLIYGPYQSTNHWLGLPATDFFAAQVGTGTIQDVKDMVAAAHAKGMTVQAYLATIYMHPTNPVFVKGAADRALNLNTFEANVFRWSLTTTGTCTPTGGGPDGFPSQGAWSTRNAGVAGNRCYVTSWAGVNNGPTGINALAGIDVKKAEGREFLKSVHDFWIDLGFDGFNWDAPQSYLGAGGTPGAGSLGERRQQYLLVQAINDRNGRAKMNTSEGGGIFNQQNYNDRIGFNALGFNTDDDANTFATRLSLVSGGSNLNIDQYEDHVALYSDARRQNGQTSFSLTPFEFASAPRRELGAATDAAGAGLILWVHETTLYVGLSTAHKEAIDRVTKAVNSSTALSPGAGRVRVPTQVDNKAWAVMRRSMDDSEKALNVFNFTNAQKCVTVNLNTTNINVPQRSTDIATGQPGPWILGNTTTIKLPAFGYQLLDVEAGPAFPWTVVDNAAPGWTYGSSWANTVDPSSFGGSRRQGNSTTNAWGEYTFTGTSVQGWGLKTTSQAQQVRVFIDGNDMGIHSQRRTAPFSGGTSFQGQQLFSISGLTPGSHLLRIQQVSNDGNSGIDYIRVSNDNWTAPTAPTGGDRCTGDTTAPVTTLDGVADEEVTPDPVSITLSATDPGATPSGVATIEYRINAGDWTEYVYEALEFSDDGTYTIDFRATDVAGNIETFQTIEFTIGEVVEKIDTTTTLESSLNPSTFGDEVTFTATVEPDEGDGTPTGSVQFTIDGDDFGTPVTLVDGQATSDAISSLTAGSHNVTAVYGGDDDFNGSTSNTLAQVVNAAPPPDVTPPVTTHELSADWNEDDQYSDPVTVTLTAEDPPEEGDWTTIDDADAGWVYAGTWETEGSSIIFNETAGATATYTFDGVAVEIYSTACTDCPASASIFIDDVLQGTTPSQLGPDADGVLMFAATGLPAGEHTLRIAPNAQFFNFDYIRVQAAGVPASGVDYTEYKVDDDADWTTYSTPFEVTGTGEHTLYYRSVDNAENTEATNEVSFEIVAEAEPIDTTTTLESSLNPSTFGQSVTFTATVEPDEGDGTPTGTVQFTIDGDDFGTPVTLVDGQATSDAISSLTAGSHNVTAVYGGDENYTGSTSDTLLQIVNQAVSTTAIESSLNPSVFGQSVTFTASVSSTAGTPTGTVQFQIDSVDFGTPVALVDGAASSAATSSLGAGSHSVTVVYGGATSFAASGDELTQVVSKAATTTTLESSANPAAHGTSITFTASVEADEGDGTPTGTVQFTIDGDDFGTPVALVDGAATSTATSTLSVGDHAVTAVYGGDDDYTGSTSATFTQTITIPVLPDCAEAPFSDVAADHPFCREITWMSDEGISTGYDDGTYRPAIEVSRMAMSAFMARLALGPDGAAALPVCVEAPFTDVAVDHPFCREITWMSDEGISTGFEDGSYQPALAVSRQAMSAFMARLALGADGAAALPDCESAPFSDVPAEQPFCSEIAWMAANGISTGYDDGTYRPDIAVSRMAMSAFMYRVSWLLE